MKTDIILPVLLKYCIASNLLPLEALVYITGLNQLIMLLKHKRGHNSIKSSPICKVCLEKRMFYINYLHVISVKTSNLELSLTPRQFPYWWKRGGKPCLNDILIKNICTVI